MFFYQTQSMKINIEKIAQQYKYCSICGGKLECKGRNLLICDNCNYHHYINPAPCNGAFLKNSKGELLLVERKVDPGKGLWDIPGGFVDLEENAEESMIREIKEETGLDIQNLKYVSSHDDTYVFGGIEFPILVIMFEGEIGNQEVKVSDDVSGYNFFKLDEIPIEKIAFEGLKKSIEIYTTRT